MGSNININGSGPMYAAAKVTGFCSKKRSVVDGNQWYNVGVVRARLEHYFGFI